MYLSGCCGNGHYTTPEEVDPWMTHLARQGYVVVAPIYQDATVLEDVPARLREALQELTQPGHPAVDLEQFAVVAYSYGGVPAVVFSVNAASEGLPVPKALFLTAPCEGPYCETVPPAPILPLGLKAVVLAYGQDFRVGPDMPLRVWSALASLPAEDRDFLTMASDGYGMPPILADHGTPINEVDAADRYGAWKLADALIACAFGGTWCEYALGDTPEQRFMGTWSNGLPVAELTVMEDDEAA
jgi:hypothetical protein